MVMPTGNYRKIAQTNWGLTDEQMKGMHVHHRVHQSNGGTNDPANLYVCSPSFHANVWHDGSYFIEQAAKGNVNSPAQIAARQVWAHTPATQKTKDAVRKTGLANKGRKLKKTHNKQAKSTNSQKWQCLVTGKISSPGPLTLYQNHRGIDVALRKRVS